MTIYWAAYGSEGQEDPGDSTIPDDTAANQSGASPPSRERDLGRRGPPRPVSDGAPWSPLLDSGADDDHSVGTIDASEFGREYEPELEIATITPRCKKGLAHAGLAVSQVTYLPLVCAWVHRCNEGSFCRDFAVVLDRRAKSDQPTQGPRFRPSPHRRAMLGCMWRRGRRCRATIGLARLSLPPSGYQSP